MKISYTDYDRITDVLLYLSNNITLNFTVSLSRKDKSGRRAYFQYETQFASKYIGTQLGRGIKRNMSFYYTLDNRNDFANGFIMRPSDVYVVTELIKNQVLPWFFDPKKRIFSITKDQSRLAITGQFEPVNYIQSDYKYISFVPIVYSFEDGTFKEGVRMYLNNQSEFADMDIDKFLGFYFILLNTDMYSVACSMVNYVKTPPYGENIFSMTGLGGGYVQDNWNESKEITEVNSQMNNNNTNGSKGNNFLNNARKK